MASEADGGSRVARVRERLAAGLAPDRLEVRDDSAAHTGHPGARDGGGHYHVLAVSTRFHGLDRVARHRLVYDLLHDLMRREVHALALTLLSPDEVASSPSDSPPGSLHAN